MADEVTVEQGAEDQVTEAQDELRETQDVKASSLAKFGVALAVGIAISMALMAGLSRFLSDWIAGGAPVTRHAVQREERLPPLPRQLGATGNRFKPEDFTEDPELQRGLGKERLNFELLSPERYREVYEQVKRRELHSYGAIANQPGRFHIPIEEAERLLIQRGAAATPAQKSGPPQSTPPPANANGPSFDAFAESPPTAASAGRVAERRRE